GARGFAHVSASPEWLSDPIPDRIAALALKRTCLLEECVDHADECVVEKDGCGYTIRVRQFAHADKLTRVIRCIRPRRRIEPAHYLPVCEQLIKAFDIAIARRPQPKPRCANIDLFENRHRRSGRFSAPTFLCLTPR